MPCYDGRDEIRNVYESGIHPSQHALVVDECRKLEGYICALLTELDKKDDAHKIIADASRNGLIGLMSFWKRHKANDMKRLADELHKFSKQEQDMLRELLNIE